MTIIHDWTKTRAAPSSRAPGPSQWLIRPATFIASATRPQYGRSRA
jgi:hypothetical protein